MDFLRQTLFQSQCDSVGPSRPLDDVEPLPCDRWLASSALQRAIRRGDILIAQRAVRTLYRHEPRSAWRRLLMVACEEVGIGAVDAVIATRLRSANAKSLQRAGRGRGGRSCDSSDGRRSPQPGRSPACNR